ncbi:MAG: SNF2-related protein [Robiginitomaculum sp.]|nr:SNF2-related protein [Robiginitomaculum sp.]
MKVINNTSELLGDDLKAQLKSGSKLKIAASCFSIYAFEALRKELGRIDSLEFIFTEPTFVPSQHSDKMRKERREFEIPRIERERSFFGTDFELSLRNKLTQRAIAKECASWIRENARFKSNRGTAPMQQFACVQSNTAETAYMPLHGFTAVDLGYQKGNAVSNFVNRLDEPTMTKTYMDLFEEIWRDPERLEDVTDALCEHITAVYQENSPERVYFLMLYNIFNEFLEDLNEDVLPNDLTGYQDTQIWNTLYQFQKDAATGLINKLETYNGCILADSVGLGKTFTAIAVIKYYELRNKSVLVLAPKKLADNWLTYNRNLKTNLFAGDRLNYDVLCHTDLQRTSGESFGTALNQINWGNYDLVVIDESHNFRNSEVFEGKETRYQKLMNDVVKAGVKTKVLMLSATPVNNRFSDLKSQLALAYEGTPDILNQKLKTTKSIDVIFKRAQAVFNAWSKLPAEERTASAILDALDFDFFELLDSVTIARSRKHITNYYDISEIGNFPHRLKPISHHCKLTNMQDVPSFNDIYSDLTQLKLCVYAPLSYVLPSRITKYEEMYDTEVKGGKSRFRQKDREFALQGLMTTNLLKRLESSIEAFRITLGKLQSNHEATLAKIEKFESSGVDAGLSDLAEAFENADADDGFMPDIDDQTIGGKTKIDLADMDLPSWKHDLSADLIIIAALLAEMKKILPPDDFKLQHLLAQIDEKVSNPFNAGNKKILIFTAFADTANYLYKHISARAQQKHGLHTACVSGSAKQTTLDKHYDFQSILTLFSPISKHKDQIMPDEPEGIDILIGTDCISEGQNLQDCDIVINYDIHWNPVRIIQRFGRVDRIGSTNNDIQLVNYWPDISLDEYINLKERVESRMVIADMAATGDDNVLSGKANDMSYRKEQLKRMQSEVIEMEDVKAGISITDLGLNDFRMDLVNYMEGGGAVKNMPNGLHAVVAANPDIGLEPGIIFTLKNVKAGAEINQNNRLHPFYLVYVGGDGDILTDHTKVKHLLDLARSACKGQDKPLTELCKSFNAETLDGRKMETYSNLLSDAIHSMIHVQEEGDVDSLFDFNYPTSESGPIKQTTALVDTIAGIDDFELIAFLVVR